MSPPDIADYSSQNRTLVGLAAYSEAELALVDRDGSAVKVIGTWAGDNLFSLLGVGPLLGRAFVPEDGAPDAPKVMVLSHGFWQDRFGGDPAALGQSMMVEETEYTVVGVMPPDFRFPGNSSFWLNRYLLSYPGRYARWMDVVGRLRPGVSLEAARADFTGIAERLEEEYPRFNRAYGTSMVSLHEAVVGDTRAPLLLLIGATAFLLLIACLNVSNLLLSRMADRGREVALRTALGAGRMRLARQRLAEGVVLAGAGAVAGLALAATGIRLLSALGPETLPRLDQVALDGGVFLFTLATTGLAAILFALVPVARLATTDIRGALQDGGKGSTAGGRRERLRSLLVVTEIALAVVLVIGAGLLARSFSYVLDTDPGFNAEGVLTLRVDLPSGAYGDLQRVADYYTAMTDRLAAVPGVESVAATASLPFDQEIPFLGNFLVGERAAPEQGEEPRAHYRQITPGYLGSMGIDVVAGREFTRGDDREAPGAVVINESLARRYFPDEDPIGRTISGLPPHLALGGFLVEEFEIVGVAEDVRYFGLTKPSEPSLYLPVAQAPFRRMSYTLRTFGNPEALAGAVRREIASLDPMVPVSRMQPLQAVLASSVARERFSATLLALFGGVALALAVIGIYGVTSYSVSQRVTEVGIRMAVGADPSQVLRMVMVQGLRLTAVGLLVGIGGGIALSRVMASQLYGVSATDPLTFTSVALTLALVSAVAIYLPARRASSLDPVLALEGGDR